MVIENLMKLLQTNFKTGKFEFFLLFESIVFVGRPPTSFDHILGLCIVKAIYHHGIEGQMFCKDQ